MTSDTSLIAAQGLTATIGELTVCRDLHWTVRSGERWAILGRNGVGKSTLLAILAGLRAPQGGALQVAGVSLTEPTNARQQRQLALQRGYLAQRQNDPFPATVLETALVGRHPHLGRWDWESHVDRRIAANALERLELSDLSERDVQTLSGGERQRLAIAQLLTQQARLNLLDEPLAHLDLAHQVSVMELFRQQTATDAALVAVLHEPGFALRYCEHALLLFGNGQWLAGRAAEILNTGNLSLLYGHTLHLLHDTERQWFVPG